MKIKNLVVLVCFALLTAAHGSPNGPLRPYPSGAEMTVKIGNDLYTTLDPAFKKAISPRPVSLQNSEIPYIAPCQEREGDRGGVTISTGFIKLLNHIAHAKAIDCVQPGYLAQYLAALAQEKGDGAPAVPPHLDNPRYWKDDVMIEQTSLFNQMIGMTLAMNLSHHYLDHCHKYAGRAPIHQFISSGEWAASVQCAALNSLDCALAPGGSKVLFDVIDMMPRRPAWTVYIIPQEADIRATIEQLSQHERAYFHGGLKAASRSLALSSSHAPQASN